MKRTLDKNLIAVVCASVGVFGSVGVAQAGSATSSEIGIDLSVTAPTCSVWNGPSAPSSGAGTASTVSAPVLLPTVSSAAMPVNTYLSFNGITAASVSGAAAGWVTSATLNQTATIQCSVANTSITNFLVQPGSGAAAVSGTTDTQYLVDTTSPTPVKAANGNLQMIFEQVQVNGSSAAFAYYGGGGPPMLIPRHFPLEVCSQTTIPMQPLFGGRS